MAPEQLIHYIRLAREAGQSREAILSSLMEAGWDPAQAAAAYIDVVPPPPYPGLRAVILESLGQFFRQLPTSTLILLPPAVAFSAAYVAGIQDPSSHWITYKTPLVIAGYALSVVSYLQIIIMIGKRYASPLKILRGLWTYRGLIVVEILRIVLIALGTALLVIPGIYMFIALQYASYLYIDGAGVKAALGASRKIAGRNILKIIPLGVMCVTFFVTELMALFVTIMSIALMRIQIPAAYIEPAHIAELAGIELVLMYFVVFCMTVNSRAYIHMHHDE